MIDDSSSSKFSDMELCNANVLKRRTIKAQKARAL